MFLKAKRVSKLRMACFPGANLDVQNSSGNTPLHFAALMGKYEIAVLLVEKGRLDQTFMVVVLHYRAVTEQMTRRIFVHNCVLNPCKLGKNSCFAVHMWS